MVILFTLLSMLSTSGSDLFEKKAVTSKTEEVLKTLVWYGIYNAVLLFAILIFAIDEITAMPLELILNQPVIVLPAILNYACLFFALFAYKYVGVSVRNTFINTDGIFYIILLLIYYFTTGRAQFASRLFTPSTTIGLLLIISASIIYPHIKYINADESSVDHSPLIKTSMGIVVIGIIISFISAFFDGTESFVSSVLLGDEVVDSIEYIVVLAIIQIIITIFIWIFLSIKLKKVYNPFRKSEKYRIVSELLTLLSDFFYIFAVSSDALLGIILWGAFPIFDIVGARIFMKEKLNRLQYLILFMLIFGSILVSLH